MLGGAVIDPPSVWTTPTTPTTPAPPRLRSRVMQAHYAAADTAICYSQIFTIELAPMTGEGLAPLTSYEVWVFIGTGVHDL